MIANSDVGLVVGSPAPVPNACYDSDLSNSTVLSEGQVQVYDSSLPPGAPAGSHSRFDCFKARFKLQLATSGVPAFNYVVLPNDHTEGTTPGRRTPDRANRLQRLGARPDRRSDLALLRSGTAR